jgi:biopolymer transport protein ExbD
MRYGLHAARQKERREVEKTALIDVIFLLLIFFFVTLAAISGMTEIQQKGGVETERYEWIPRWSDAVTPAPKDTGCANYVVVDVRQVKFLKEMETINTVITNFRNLAQKETSIMDGYSSKFNDFTYLRPFQNEEEFAVILYDENCCNYKELLSKIVILEETLGKYAEDRQLTLRNQILNLVTYLPRRLPTKDITQFSDDLYLSSMAYLKGRILTAFNNNKELQVHVRSDKLMYYRFIFDILSFCGERQIQLDYSNLRVIKSST